MGRYYQIGGPCIVNLAAEVGLAVLFTTCRGIDICERAQHWSIGKPMGRGINHSADY